jgi:Zn-dependent protease
LISYLLYGASGSGFRWMIGWASAPYDPLWEDRHPRRSALMAAAGPAANLLLAVLAFAALKTGIAADLWSPHSYQLDHLVSTGVEQNTITEGLGRFCSVMLSLNVLLFLFNLLPLPPMDGATVLAGYVPPMRRLRDMMRASPMVALLGLLVAWRVFPYLFGPLYYGLILGWLFGGA